MLFLKQPRKSRTQSKCIPLYDRYERCGRYRNSIELERKIYLNPAPHTFSTSEKILFHIQCSLFHFTVHYFGIIFFGQVFV